ncbi:HAD family hydrolase [Chelativorans salis]|uniref:HAD family hydrolase n=1 Tax=Chelativorans salis TaxID=2978478 RepID=A0ABT2LX71_9HYPH|nr:HAD family hydrolase [Chelativorans sp. EGI FJ00035]MCT7378193.1 HAD family hydrolase [Chelativorans sp. EGI FJ00035]
MRSDRLVIFDCDGVLVDSEPISIAVLLEVITAAGATIEPSVAYRRFLGRSMASIAKAVEDECGLAMTDGHLEEMRARLYERFRQELKPIPGLVETLAGLHPPHCVASSSQPERIRLSLGVTGLLSHFEPHIFSATMVANGKPAPDLFLHAATMMGVEPAKCVVIEDSPAGIEAARRAGMQVMAFAGGSHAAPAGLKAAFETLGPDSIFHDMRELPALLARIDKQLQVPDKTPPT